MRNWPSFTVLIAVLTLLVTVACFDYDEEVWLNADGSGRALLTLRIADQLMAMADIKSSSFSEADARKKFAATPGILVDRVTQRQEAGMAVYEFALRFDSLTHLAQALAASNDKPELKTIGNMTITKEDGHFLFRHTVQSTGDKKISTDPISEGMAAMFLANHYMTYRLHSPFKIIAANGTIAPDSRTVEWKFALVRAMREDLDMWAQLKAPLPWWLLLFGAAIAGMALIVLVVVLTSRSNRAVV